MIQPVITEEWRKIPGFPSIYEVSNFGEVRSHSRTVGGEKLSLRNDRRNGLPEVRLSVDWGRRRWCSVHKLVAAAFPEGE